MHLYGPRLGEIDGRDYDPLRDYVCDRPHGEEHGSRPEDVVVKHSSPANRGSLLQDAPHSCSHSLAKWWAPLRSLRGSASPLPRSLPPLVQLPLPLRHVTRTLRA